MSTRSSYTLFATPSSGEAENSYVAEIRAGKRRIVETIETEVGPPAQRPRLTVGPSSPPASLIEVIEIEDDDDEDDHLIVDIKHVERKKVSRNQIPQFVREELDKVYQRRVRQAVKGTQLWRTLADIRVVIKNADKKKMLDRYRSVWKRTLTVATNTLSTELNVTERAMALLGREEDIQVVEAQILKNMRLRLKHAKQDAKKQEDLITFLKCH